MPRRDSIELAKRYLFAPDEETGALAPTDKVLLAQIRDCYSVWLSNPTYTNTQMRNYLMHQHGVDKQKAYSIIAMTTAVLGNVEAANKNWIKTVIQDILQQAFILAQNDQLKKAEIYTKIAQTYAKAFNTAVDEGETLNMKEHVNIEQVVITSNPADIGITLDGHERRDVQKLLKKYDIHDDIIDIKAEEVNG